MRKGDGRIGQGGLGDTVVAGPGARALLRAENFYRYQVMMRTLRMSALGHKLSTKRETFQIPDDIRLVMTSTR
ncbi:MAG: hypothetical protein CM1200mP29_16390 [Verrucomicrobiota bacterium]|nr:MAG: hypothetical protein CM1200mP29_16390 [Verrucomicrobiota bacterium]